MQSLRWDKGTNNEENEMEGKYFEIKQNG